MKKLGIRLVTALAATALILVGGVAPAAQATWGYWDWKSDKKHDTKYDWKQDKKHDKKYDWKNPKKNPKPSPQKPDKKHDKNNWTYAAPDCTSLTVKYPKKASGNHVNVKLEGRGADAGKTVTLNFHSKKDWSGTKTFDFASHKAWPNWSQWSVTWVQVAGTNYHWKGDIECGEAPTKPSKPSKAKVCVWDSATDTATKQYVKKPGQDDIMWVDGSECTPKLKTLCFDTGDGFEMIEVRKDGDYEFPVAPKGACDPPEVFIDVCGPVLDDNDEVVGWTRTTISDADYADWPYPDWNDDLFAGGCAEPQAPTLAGSQLSGICIADSPWLAYNIEVHNPDGVDLDGFAPGEEPDATITFLNPDGDDFVVSNIALGSGTLLWPGGAVSPAEGLTEGDMDPLDPSTFVPTAWPGWHQDQYGDWVEDTDPQENYGWTRDGVDVRVEVSPSITFTVNYPPASPECNPGPPEVFEDVLGVPPLDVVAPPRGAAAPPAVAVLAEATYTG